ncbi:MAG: ABC transporter permease [Clostridiales bacterium]|nr:ABC transporter permease [Clostridiales bacterium]
MTKYIIKRILWMIPVLLCVVTIVFTITYFTPGDPVLIILGAGNYTPEAYAKKAAELGLDRSYIGQLTTYIWNLVTKLDLGRSFLTNIPVSNELMVRIPVSFRLSLMGIAVMVSVGLPLGMISALKQYSILDTTLTSISLIIAAMPAFVMAILNLLIFGVILRVLPTTGLDSWRNYILPVVSAAGSGIGVYLRMTRTTMLEVIRQDYIRTARAKGQIERVVIQRHALRNCLIPLVTVIGAFVATVFSGSIIVETIFNITGMGTYLMGGLLGRDYPIINGTVFVICTLVCTVNLCVDIAYAFIDPRVKAQFTSPRKRAKIVKELIEVKGEAS